MPPLGRLHFLGNEKILLNLKFLLKSSNLMTGCRHSRFVENIGVFMFVLIGNIAPILGVIYLILYEKFSEPFATRVILAVLFLFWIWELDHRKNIKMQAVSLDWIMAGFFILAEFGYIRSGLMNSSFEYFAVLNMLAYLIGRFTYANQARQVIRLHLYLSMLVVLVFVVSLPELYHQWGISTTAHPILYGVINTAGGLDVIVGYLPLLAGVYLIKNQGVLVWRARIVLVVGILLMLLMGSKAVLVSLILSLFMVVALINRWRQLTNLGLCAVIGFAVAFVIAPPGNKAFYSHTSVNAGINAIALTQQEGSAQIDEARSRKNISEVDSGVARVRLAEISFGQIRSNMVWGIGAQNWNYYSPHPHNIVLEAAVMFGIPAALLLLTFFLRIIYRVSRESGWSSVAIVSLVVFLAIYNLFQGQLGSFRSFPLFVLSGYAVSVLVAQRGRNKTVHKVLQVPGAVNPKQTSCV